VTGAAFPPDALQKFVRAADAVTESYRPRAVHAADRRRRRAAFEGSHDRVEHALEVRRHGCMGERVFSALCFLPLWCVRCVAWCACAVGLCGDVGG
jgi:hypothetical protein